MLQYIPKVDNKIFGLFKILLFLPTQIPRELAKIADMNAASHALFDLEYIKHFFGIS